jgi:hypothetical protein
MRHSLIAILAVTSSAALLGCEDGPNQTYSPAPDGAAARWNDGNNTGTYDTGAKQGFVQNQSAGSNAQELCSGPQRAARWAAMVLDPILPPGQAAGIDGYGGTSYNGVTIAQAEAINCQSEPSGVTFGDSDIVNQWGDSGEVWVKYNPNTQKVSWFVLNNGYQGKMTFQSRDGAHTFVIELGNQILKDGQSIALDWYNHTQTGMDAQGPIFDPASYEYKVTDFVDAMFATFAPELAAEDPTHGTCVTSGRCLETLFGGEEGVTRIYPLGIHIWMDNPSAPQPTPTTPTRLDMRLPRIEPYTYAYTTMKLDEEGPVAIATGAGPGGSDCKLQLGTTWGSFDSQCIQTTGDPTKDSVFENLLMGSIQHDSERYTFDITGVDVNATSVSLGQTGVLHDGDRPQAADLVSSLYVDAATLGFIANDAVIDPNGVPQTDPISHAPTQDWHGSGLVYLEYANIVQSTINQLLLQQNPKAVTHQLGDPACMPDIAPPGSDPTNCTGFEGILTAAPPPTDTTSQAAANRVGPTAIDISQGYLALGLKPGHPYVMFCNDATGYVDDGMGNKVVDPNGYADCIPADLFDGSFQQVIGVLGQGDINNLPSAIRDRRFFFKSYVTALMKLFKGTQLNGSTPADLSMVNLVTNDFFFDAEGGGQYERGEYVDRATENKMQGLTDVEIVCDILNGTMLSYQFFRSIYRGEAAVYGTVATDPTLPPGKEETGLMSNIYGSPALAANWVDHMAMDANGNALTPRSAYYCASTDWTTKAQYDALNAECEGNIPPTDPSYNPDPNNKNAPPALPLRENGVPLLQPYPHAFDLSAPLTLGLGGQMTLISENLQDNTAVVQVPQPAFPGPVQVVVPYTPPRPGFGWTYPLEGTRDEVIQAGLLNFAGTTLTGVMYYTTSPELGSDGTPDGTTLININAMYSEDYLGDAFVCIEGNDILRAKMYDPVLPMLEWLDAHPAAYADCGIIIRYSVFDNYPDYIISQYNGVVLGTTQGAGFGRVEDIELFTPGSYLEQALGAISHAYQLQVLGSDDGGPRSRELFAGVRLAPPVA